MDIKTTGKVIAQLRKNNGYTQESLAEILHISPQAVSKWETGLGLPDTSLLIELSNLSGVTIDEILQPNKKKNTVTDFINRNLAAPIEKTLDYIPRIDRWNPPDGCDMYYSMPAMIAEALCCVEAQERGQPDAVTMTCMNERFYDLMHIMGVGYGFLWHEKRHMIEELWRINDLRDMADRAMRYYGRDYIWLTNTDATADEMRRIIMWSIDKGRPIVMEWAGGIPEFSIVTGYKDNGNMLVGWTYCGECAVKTNDKGMFINPARWNESYNFHVLVIGDKTDPTYTDKRSIEYALEVLDRTESGNRDFAVMTAGDEAYQRWLQACDTTDNTIKLFTISDIFTHALYMNSIYTQNCILKYYKKLSSQHDKNVSEIVVQMVIALGKIEGERNGLNSRKDDPEAYAGACRRHIENLIKHKEQMRDWMKKLQAIV